MCDSIKCRTAELCTIPEYIYTVNVATFKMENKFFADENRKKNVNIFMEFMWLTV